MDSPPPEKAHDAHPQSDHNPEDDADLQSFIQSGMGIALPPLSMGMDVHDAHHESGSAHHHEESGFEVGDFRELMRDGAAGDRQRGRQVPREEEREGSGERGDGEHGSHVQKRAREGTEGDELEEDGISPDAVHEAADAQRNKRPRTTEQSPAIDISTLHGASSTSIQPASVHQETTLTSVPVSAQTVDTDILPLLTPPSGRPETAEERKARQREANRLAAGRSRGKKRDELAILEKTVQNIQEENNRLRAQLEALVSAAHQPAVASSSNVRQEDAGLGSAGLQELHNVQVLGLNSADNQRRDIQRDGSATQNQRQHEQTPPPSVTIAGKLVDVPLGFGIDGVDMQVLDGLRRQLEAARKDVAEVEARLVLGRSSSPSETDVRSLAAAKTRTATLAEEKQALVHLIESLKRERDEVELERDVLERELIARRLLIAGTEEGEMHEGSGGEGKKGRIGGEPGRDVGVERALMEVRSWLDNALTGWQKTGVLQPPSSILDDVPNPPIDVGMHGHSQLSLQDPMLDHSGAAVHVPNHHDDPQNYELDTTFGHDQAMHDDAHSRVQDSPGGGSHHHLHHHEPSPHDGQDHVMMQSHEHEHEVAHEGMLDPLEFY